MLVIGLTGKNCAGKDATADILADAGMERWSLSDVLRVELRRRGKTITRDALIELGNELRRTEGPAVLAERVQGLIRTERVCLVSVRSPAEVASLRRLHLFVLWALEAPPDVRYRREIEREHLRGERVPASLEAFLEIEAREDTDDEHAQQLGAAIALADEHVMNDGTLEDLRVKVLGLLGGLDG